MSTYPTFDYSAKPWETSATPAGKGGTGTIGLPGNNGSSHYDGGNCQWVCDSPPNNGGQGGTGQTPQRPSKAQQGRPAGVVTQNIGLCSGHITIWYGAGDGQQGGAGGPGGDGGQGGPPGVGATGCNNAGNGPQGMGGTGGDGGDGGDGGVTGLITIYYTDPNNTATFSITQVGCGGGNGGQGGPPGNGVGSGNTGQPGQGGVASQPPKINLQKV